MNCRKLLQQMSGVALVVLFSSACAVPTPIPPTTTPVSPTATAIPPRPTATPITATPTPVPSVRGSLLNKDTGKPLTGARVILCTKGTEETACVIDIDLTSVTDSAGQFSITGVLPGKYVLLHNASGRIRSEWDGMKLNYSPVTTAPNMELNVHKLMRSLGVSSLSNCEAFVEVVDGNLVASGYMYADQLDLAFIFLKGDLVYVKVQDGWGSIDLRVWDTANKDGCKGEFNPVK